MLRVVVAASLIATLGCRHSLDEEPSRPTVDAGVSAACQEATTYSNLNNIEEKIFKASCIFSGCHNGGATPQGMLDLRTGRSFASLVNVTAEVDTTRKRVVPGQPTQSHLLLMLGHIAPAAMNPPAMPPPPTIGLMPQNAGGQLLCSQKLEAIERWISMGALNN